MLALLTPDERDLDAGPALTHAFIAVRRPADGKHLLVFDRFRQRWELAGGKMEPGEGPRACAVRELHEEAGLPCVADALRFVGIMKFLLSPNRFHPEAHVEHGALYAVEAEPTRPFVPNEEIAQITWWNEEETIGPLSAIDHRLIHLAWPTS